MYEGEDYDLAGFCVGVAEKSEVIDGSNVKPGQALIGLASSGPHSNGYSLIRKIIEVTGADLNQDINGQTLADALMAPTRIYVKPVLKLIAELPVHAISHITGGGLQENLPRVLPENAKAVVNLNSWQRPEVFNWIQRGGNVDEYEMYRTLNCGVGMILVVDQENAQRAIDLLNTEGETAWQIGCISEASANEEQVELQGLKK